MCVLMVVDGDRGTRRRRAREQHGQHHGQLWVGRAAAKGSRLQVQRGSASHEPPQLKQWGAPAAELEGREELPLSPRPRLAPLPAPPWGSRSDA